MKIEDSIKKGTMIPVRDSKDKRNINMYNSE